MMEWHVVQYIGIWFRRRWLFAWKRDGKWWFRITRRVIYPSLRNKPVYVRIYVR